MSQGPEALVVCSPGPPMWLSLSRAPSPVPSPDRLPRPSQRSALPPTRPPAPSLQPMTALHGHPVPQQSWLLSTPLSRGGPLLVPPEASGFS